MRYELIDGKPVPARLAPELRACGVGGDISLFSCLRTQDAVNWARSKGATLSSQKELFDGFVQGLPGFNPANPVGRSTHELRNDGVAFPGPAGMWLPYYKVGIDCSNVALLCERGKARGWTVTLTYPTNPRESHHANFRKEPRLITFKALRIGARGPRVGKMTRRLAYLGYISERQGLFDGAVRSALIAFQKDWPNLVDDGVYGVHTARQLATAARGLRACRRAAKRRWRPTARKARKAEFAVCSAKWGKRR